MKRTALALALIWVFLASTLVGFQFVSFADARAIPAYSVYVSIQSPNGSYAESTIPLIVNATLYFGTNNQYDEVSLQNVTCKYSLDDGEWKNITSMTVTSHTTQPDINFWSGLLHVINCTYNTTLQDLSEGSHFLNVTVKSDADHQGSSSVYFTVGSIPEFPSWTPSLLIMLVAVVAVTVFYRHNLKKHNLRNANQWRV